ncbi:unnamed protein product [Closterium sp. NIES-64]|nr:unnamed protein product [Closterium sp. NIES-64]
MIGDDNNICANGGGGGASASGGLLQLVESPIPEQKIFNSLPFPLVLTPRVLPNPASTSAPSTPSAPFAPSASLSANASGASAPASPSSSPQPVPLATSASSPSDAAAPHVSDAVAWIRANREWLLDTWQIHGAVLLRGLPLESPGDFNEVVEAFGLDELPYVGGAAPRTKVIGRLVPLRSAPSTCPSLHPSPSLPPPHLPHPPISSPSPHLISLWLLRMHSTTPHLMSYLLTALNRPSLTYPSLLLSIPLHRISPSCSVHSTPLHTSYTPLHLSPPLSTPRWLHVCSQQTNRLRIKRSLFTTRWRRWEARGGGGFVGKGGGGGEGAGRGRGGGGRTVERRVRAGVGRVPEYPTRLLFFCQVPPATGGETPILPSCELTRRLAVKHPSFIAQLRAKGLLYVRVLPEEDDPSSAIGRGWKSTFLTDSREEAEEKAAKLGVKLEWQADGSVRTVSGPIPALRVDTRPLPSLSTKPRVAQEEVRDEQVREEEVGEGEVREAESWEEEVREAWFNSMVAAYTGWKDVRNDPTKAVTFGDGEVLPGEAVLAVEEEMERLAVAVPWRRGEGEEMREEGDAWGLTDDGGGEREEREECRRGKDESEAGERDEGGGRSEEREEEGDESEGKVGGGGREGAREGGGGKAESSRGLEVRPEGGQRKERGAVDEGGLREGEKEREEEREGGGKDAKGIHGGEIRPEREQWKEEEGVAGEEEGREEAGDAEEEEEGGEKEKEKEEVEEDEKGKEKDEDKEKEEEKAEEEDEEEEEYVYLDLSQAVRRLPRNCRLIIENLESESPTLHLPDGSTLVGDYEETLGSCLFFQETLVPAAASAPPSNASGPSTFPAGAAAAAGGGVPPALGEQAMAGKQGPAVGGEQKRKRCVKYIGKTELRLTFRKLS